MFKVQAQDVVAGMRVKVKPCRRLQPVYGVRRGVLLTELVFDIPPDAFGAFEDDQLRDDNTTKYHPETVIITNHQPITACSCNGCANLRPCAQQEG